MHFSYIHINYTILSGMNEKRPIKCNNNKERFCSREKLTNDYTTRQIECTSKNEMSVMQDTYAIKIAVTNR